MDNSKSILYSVAILIVCGVIAGCTERVETRVEAPEAPAPPVSGFDSLLAAELRADDYGMGRFVVAFLKAGPNRNQDSTAAAELQKAHLENIGRLAEEGKLVLAGPFMDDGQLRGIYVFDVETVEEARALTETDPAIQQGRLEMELRPWYGSAALRKIGEIHRRIAKENP